MTVQIPKPDFEPLEAYLLEAGALSITCEDAQDQPLFEPAPGQELLWDQIRIKALFEMDADIDAVIDYLHSPSFADKVEHVDLEVLEDKIWEREWMTHFKPMRFGRRLWICPSNQKLNEKDAVVVDLDPGLAFGTGTHETTALCLEWLDGQDLTGKRVVDYGCGSGVLAIAALKLGAAHCLAIDNDPQALIATRENAARNGVEKQITLSLPGETEPGDGEPVVLANILAGILIDNAETITAFAGSEAELVLSGILAEQVESVKKAFAPWFANFEIKQQGDWVILTSQKHS